MSKTWRSLWHSLQTVGVAIVVCEATEVTEILSFSPL